MFKVYLPFSFFLDLKLYSSKNLSKALKALGPSKVFTMSETNFVNKTSLAKCSINFPILYESLPSLFCTTYTVFT